MCRFTKTALSQTSVPVAETALHTLVCRVMCRAGPEPYIYIIIIYTRTFFWQGNYHVWQGNHHVFLAGKSPSIRSYTVYIYDSGQPYTHALQAAATTVQAAWRGHVTRALLQRQQQAALCVQSQWRRRVAMADLARARQAVTRVQACWRGWAVRRQVAQQGRAATVLQVCVGSVCECV